MAGLKFRDVTFSTRGRACAGDSDDTLVEQAWSRGRLRKTYEWISISRMEPLASKH